MKISQYGSPIPLVHRSRRGHVDNAGVNLLGVTNMTHTDCGRPIRLRETMSN